MASDFPKYSNDDCTVRRCHITIYGKVERVPQVGQRQEAKCPAPCFYQSSLLSVLFYIVGFWVIFCL